MLPPLLFESSFKINSHLFFSKLRLIVALTVVVYFITLLLAVAFMLPLLLHTEKCKISGVFLFISIIVATDPVAVVAILEQYGAPHRLRILIEGESLLNDGLALTTYRILIDILKVEMSINKQIFFRQQLFKLFICIFISPLMGCLSANIVSWIVKRLRENKKRQAFILVSVYGMFMICDTCNASPALGLVSFGIMLSSYRESMTPETSQVALEIWQTMGYWANNVIFIFAGYCVGNEMFSRTYREITDSVVPSYLEIETDDIFILMEGVLLSPIPLFSRIVSVYLFYKYYGLISRKPLPSRRDFTILAYAGLRGALGLILAMELHQTLGGNDAKKILLLTCSSTFTCLVFQGMTFFKLATKEGTTKRSKYVKDTCVRLSKFLDKKVRETLYAMQLDYSSYLIGTNWQIVEEQVKECLRKNVMNMENDMIQQQDELSQEEIWSSDEEKDAQAEKNIDTADARIGLYGILLARVHDSWARGAVSGSTAHVIIALLEHGIDEGNVFAEEIEDYLKIIEPNIFSHILFRISETIFKWIRQPTFINEFAEMGNYKLFPKEELLLTKHIIPRSFEKWWIFHTLCICSYSVALAYYILDGGEDVNRAVVYMICAVIWLMNVMETLYIFHKEKSTWEQKTAMETMNISELNNRRRPSMVDGIFWRELWPTVFFCSIITVAFFLSVVILDNGKCIPGHTFMNTNCNFLRLSHFAIIVMCSFYKLTRMTPVFIVVLREYCIKKKLSRNRIRLSVFHYLHHLMTETKISRDLFSDNAYKTVRKEVKKFNKLVEGLIRLELKENAAEIEVVPVIKTRQAIRMMSFKLSNTLAELKTEGFMPEDAKDRWEEVVDDLHARAENILWVPQLTYSDWMHSVKWIRKLKERKRKKIIDVLITSLKNSKVHKFSSGEVIQTYGSTMWFIKKGVCKVTEWLVGQVSRHHEGYAGQGEFIGERNILKHKWTGSKLPLMWPKRRYETTTYCEMVLIDGVIIEKLIDIEPSIYTIINNEVQAERMMTELKHLNKSSDITSGIFWSGFQKYGKTLGKPEQLTVPDGKIAIVGCWTQVTLVAPRSSMNKDFHIRGPSTLWVEPADDRAAGFVYFEKLNNEENLTTGEASNVSLIHDEDNKVRIRNSALISKE